MSCNHVRCLLNGRIYMLVCILHRPLMPRCGPIVLTWKDCVKMRLKSQKFSLGGRKQQNYTSETQCTLMTLLTVWLKDTSGCCNIHNASLAYTIWMYVHSALSVFIFKMSLWGHIRLWCWWPQCIKLRFDMKVSECRIEFKLKLTQEMFPRSVSNLPTAGNGMNLCTRSREVGLKWLALWINTLSPTSGEPRGNNSVTVTCVYGLENMLV